MARVELATDRSPIPASAALERALAPSNIRYKVLSLTFLVAFIMYMDRVCMGTAAPAIMREFGLDKISMGWSVSAFNWAYAIFQVPAGWMADRFGPRVILTVALAWWSVFTAATGASFGAISLTATRFLFGMGEAAAFPASSRAVVRWLPVAQRGFGQGVQHSGSRLGAAIAPALVVYLLYRTTWPWVFWMYLFWFPTYLVEARHFSQIKMGLGASLPLLAATVMNVAGGWISDKLTCRWSDLRRGRLAVSVIGFAIAAVGLVPGVLAKDALTGVLCLTFALAGLELTVAVSWAISLDIGGDYTGSVSGVMNTLGNLGGALSSVVIGYLATKMGWNWPFLVASAMCLAAALLATRINPNRSAVAP